MAIVADSQVPAGLSLVLGPLVAAPLAGSPVFGLAGIASAASTSLAPFKYAIDVPFSLRSIFKHLRPEGGVRPLILECFRESLFQNL